MPPVSCRPGWLISRETFTSVSPGREGGFRIGYILIPDPVMIPPRPPDQALI